MIELYHGMIAVPKRIFQLAADGCSYFMVFLQSLHQLVRDGSRGRDAFVFGIWTVDGPDISDFDFRSLLANLHGSLAVTDGAVSGW